MKASIFVCILSLLVVCAVKTKPCCHAGFEAAHHCRDLSPALCSKIGGVTLPGSSCASDTCGKTCANGRREPWEDCDGESWCDDKCKAFNGTCCSYGPKSICFHGPKSECKDTRLEVRYFVPSNSCEDCPKAIPKQMVCLSGQPCCECTTEWFFSGLIGFLVGGAIGLCCCYGGFIAVTSLMRQQKKNA